ncbi:MAG: hypothetical protein IJ451_04955 [Ruminococcus sp.]|nr:hypothetical protein [Ruminococcus sp.]
MALNSLETIRNAEHEASEQIANAESEARLSLQNAELEAKGLIANAKKDANSLVEHKAEKAKQKADEIVISAQNSAKLEAERQKSEALKNQDSVNNLILQIII